MPPYILTFLIIIIIIIIIIMIIIIIIICCSVLEDEQKWAYLTLSFDLGKYFSETEGCVQDL